MRAPQFVLRTHYSMYRRCPQRWRIATVATDTPPNLLPVQGLYRNLTLYISNRNRRIPPCAIQLALAFASLFFSAHTNLQLLNATALVGSVS